MKKWSLISRIRNQISRHKIIWTFILIIIVLGGYYSYAKIKNSDITPQYTLSKARIGSIIQTINGSGQVSASNQIDIQSKVSGPVISVDAKVGQHVSRGQLLARIDSSAALFSLQNARISMSKLLEPPKSTDLADAQNSLNKAYEDAYNSITSFYLDTPAVITGLKDLFHSQNTYLSEQESSNLIPAAREYLNDALTSFDRTSNQYYSLLNQYKQLSRSSGTATIETFLQSTSELAKDLAAVMQKTQNTITLISKVQPSYETSKASAASTAKSNVQSWSNLANNSLTSLLNSDNSIKNNINSLKNLTSGPSELDIESQQLSLKQQEQNYADYFIRAPFDGIIGRISVNPYQQVGNSTVIATIIGEQKIATISLNEIDAAKVKSGNPVNITFDAIDGLNATGVVGDVDLVGTVNQGVVTYNVKILINSADERILPGMSVNASIITNRKDNVLVVPSAAVKTQGNRSYVQVFRKLPESSGAIATSTANMNNFRNRNFASSTGQFASTTRSGTFGQNNLGQNRTLNIDSKVPPEEVFVTTGISDENNTEISEGLNGDEWVIIKNSTGATKTTSAPSILNSLGGNRNAGNATFRTVRQ